jgi:Ser/Thr protein kinase RdoA (MazF antagonist)
LAKATTSPWGARETKFFYELTPERILDAVEATGVRCTGRCLQLNSMENRVYQIEIETDDPEPALSRRFLVAKFYRPGRWSEQQILDEHRFLLDLVAEEIPVVAPIAGPQGATLSSLGEPRIWRVGGRAPEELSDPQLEQLGRLLARVHGVGAARAADSRLRLDPATYGLDNLAYLLDAQALPERLRDAYRGLVEGICSTCEPWFSAVEYQRIHGDCHLGNVLWGPAGAFLVDFDDMVRGPCVQDVWLLTPGSDTFARRQREVLICAYEQIRAFDRASLRLVEALRALRYVHFSAWIARRWDDPAFKRVFPDFGTERYWNEQMEDLREQLALVRESEWL